VQDLQHEVSFDSIDEASQSALGGDVPNTDPDHMDDDEEILFESLQQDSSLDEEPPNSHASKRIKLSDQEYPTPGSPDRTRTIASTMGRPTHRFITSPPRPTVESDVQDTIVVSKRQAFLLSANLEEGRSEADPLPIHFSPHRKGQKFEPGGLAASMRSHIMDMTSSTSHKPSHRKTECWQFEIRDVVGATPFILARGTMDDGKMDQFLLAGSRMLPKVGDIMQIQGITWRVNIADQNWMVCIDWKTVK
jgi:hypothetical protein